MPDVVVTCIICIIEYKKLLGKGPAADPTDADDDDEAANEDPEGQRNGKITFNDNHLYRNGGLSQLPTPPPASHNCTRFIIPDRPDMDGRAYFIAAL